MAIEDNGFGRPGAQAGHAPIAVIGIGCRFAGGVDSADRLWESLIQRADLVGEIPSTRWDLDGFYDPELGAAGCSVSRWGGFVDDVYGFDAGFFNISDLEAAHMDPQQRILLEVTVEALENAGIALPRLAEQPVGVFHGISYADYQIQLARAGALVHPYAFSGVNPAVASGRISYQLGLHGPAITLDTACSSSLSAVHLAIQSLRGGETSLALAGGVSLHLQPDADASASAQGMLSPRGRCAAFDIEADGFVRAEGCAVVALKRLDDAICDGDRVLAVIRGSAINQDGRSQGLTAPDSAAQERVQRAALADGGIDPNTVGLIEAHGTGTPVGDPVEWAALRRVYGRGGNRCAVGSVKTNLGHTETVSGIAGLIKAVGALRHGTIPANLHFTQLNPALDAEATGLFVPSEAIDWPEHTGPRRAAVSSYGFSGTNAHIVVEAPPAAAARSGPQRPGTQESLFVLSASEPNALSATASRVADWLISAGAETDLADIARTLACHRTHRASRLAVIAGTRQDLVAGLRATAAAEAHPGVVRAESLGTARRPLWVFSGHGSQWPGMGRSLLTHNKAFSEAVHELDALIAAEAGFSVIDQMCSDQPDTAVDRVQPTVLAVQVGLAAAWRARGVHPAAVIGHSMGEVAAAVVAGRLSPADGVKVICRRTRAMKRISGAGAMASIELPIHRLEADLATYGADGVTIGVYSSPESSVISGDAEQVRALVHWWELRDVSARLVPVEVASHSPQVESILDEISVSLAELSPLADRSGQVTFYSTVLGLPTAPAAFDAQYWVRNLRDPVRFSAALRAAFDDGHRVFVEISPHPLMLKAIDDTARAVGVAVASIPTLRRDQTDSDPIIEQVAAVHCAGACVDFEHLCGDGQLVDVPLPTWSHQQYRIEAGPQTTAGSVHDLECGEGIEIPGTPGDLLWRADVGTVALPWGADHQVFDAAVLPGAAFAELALEAAEQIYGPGAEVRDLGLHEALLASDHTMLTMVAERATADQYRWEATSQDDDRQPVRHACATLAPATGIPDGPVYDLDALYRGGLEPVDLEETRSKIVARGVHHGPSFRGLTALYRVEGVADGAGLIGELRLPSALRGSRAGVHPALLDACFQALLGSVDADGEQLVLPVSMARIRRFGPAGRPAHCLVRPRQYRHNTTAVAADVDVIDSQGRVVLRVEHLVLDCCAPHGADSPDRSFDDRVLAVQWGPCDPHDNGQDATDLGKWLVLGEDSGELDDPLPGRLADELTHWGATVSTVSAPLDADDSNWVNHLVSLGSRPRSGLVVVLAPVAGIDLRREQAGVARLIRIFSELAQVTTLHVPRVYVVTRGCQPVGVTGDDSGALLGQSSVRGLCRVAGAEHPELRVVHIDTDAHTDASCLAYEIASDDSYDETAWRHDRRYVARLRNAPLTAEDRHERTVRFGVDNYRIVVREPGDLSSVELQAIPRTAPGPTQVEVANMASSLNFADALAAMGRVQTYDGGLPALGVEMAGQISAVGDAVRGWAPGDRVLALARPGIGGWQAFDTLEATDVHRIPANMTAADAAALLGTYVTAWYSLHTLADLQPGERVLIHSATGGVGMAALAIARLLGAEVFATAGTPQKRELLQQMGIRYIYDSRSVHFADQIRKDTGGEGVDVVLNSLTGQAQRVSIDLLAIGGRFVEIGKKDIYADAKIGLAPFRRNIAFYSVDLLLLRSRKNALCNRLIREVLDLVRDGDLPLISHREYPLSETADALRTMGGARHTGKLVLTFPTEGSGIAVIDPSQVPVARPDGAYILTGGLGGLGLLLAEYLSEAGAGRIVVNARSHPSEEAASVIESLRARGTDIVVELGDICAPATSVGLIDAATATGLPVRGIVHAAAVVDDAAIVNIDQTRLDRNWNPKVLGAWNLHTAIVDQPLDWFCCFSSGAALLGSAGQGAYAAANSWMDAFVAWRRAQGLTATSIAWGAWAQVGRGAFLGEDGRTAMISPREGIAAFDRILRHRRGFVGYLPTTNAPWVQSLAARSPFASAFAAAAEPAMEAQILHALNQVPIDDRAPFLQKYLCAQIAAIIRAAAVDPSHRFTECGLDSLGKLELRTRIDKDLGVRVSTKNLWEHDTAHALALHLLDRTDLSLTTTDPVPAAMAGATA